MWQRLPDKQTAAIAAAHHRVANMSESKIATVSSSTPASGGNLPWAYALARDVTARLDVIEERLAPHHGWPLDSTALAAVTIECWFREFAEEQRALHRQVHRRQLPDECDAKCENLDAIAHLSIGLADAGFGRPAPVWLLIAEAAERHRIRDLPDPETLRRVLTRNITRVRTALALSTRRRTKAQQRLFARFSATAALLKYLSSRPATLGGKQADNS